MKLVLFPVDSGAFPMRSSAVPPAERVTSLDVVRGVALYGVMAMNLVVDGFRVSLFERFLPETTPKPWLDQVVENFLLASFDLKAFALFSFLFGIGLAIQFDRLQPARRTLLLVRRLAVLLTIGIIHLVFIWNGDILTEYAVVGFVALPFLFGSRLLLAMGSICLLAFYAAFPATMPIPDAMWFREHVSAATSIYPTGDYAAILKLRIEELQGFLPLHVGIFPRTLGLFLLGAFIWRTGLVSQASDNRDILAGIALLGVLATVGLRSNALADVTLALTYAAVIFAIMTTQAGSKLLGWAAPLGRMAFTNYLLQSLIFGFVFYGYGLGLFGKVGVTATLCFGTAVYVGQVMLSRRWLRNHTFGPVEWLWRRLMYGSPQETAA